MTHVEHEVWQRVSTTRNFTTVLTFLYCGTSTLANGWRLYYVNDAGSYNGAACKAQNTSLVAAPNCMHRGHAVQCTSRMLNVFARQVRSGWHLKLTYGIAIATHPPIFFPLGHCVNIGVQQDSFLVPVPSGVAKYALQKHSKVSSSSARWLYTFVMRGGEKSIGKALLLVGFLSYLDSRTNQTQAVILEKKWTAIRFPSWYGTRRSQTD